jgi:hypothetical protein
VCISVNYIHQKLVLLCVLESVKGSTATVTESETAPGVSPRQPSTTTGSKRADVTTKQQPVTDVSWGQTLAAWYPLLRMMDIQVRTQFNCTGIKCYFYEIKLMFSRWFYILTLYMA